MCLSPSVHLRSGVSSIGEGEGNWARRLNRSERRRSANPGPRRLENAANSSWRRECNTAEKRAWMRGGRPKRAPVCIDFVFGLLSLSWWEDRRALRRSMDCARFSAAVAATGCQAPRRVRRGSCPSQLSAAVWRTRVVPYLRLSETARDRGTGGGKRGAETAWFARRRPKTVACGVLDEYRWGHYSAPAMRV